MTAGVLAALVLGWYALSRQGLALKPASLLLLLILVPMLLTRQLLQDHAVLPLTSDWIKLPHSTRRRWSPTPTRR